MSEKWEKIKKELEKSLKSGIFELWIKPLRGDFEDNTLFLKAPNNFVASWVKKKLFSEIKRITSEVLNKKDIDVVVQCSSNGNGKLPLKRTSLPFLGNFYGKKKIIVWRHSFDDFVVGLSNELAYNVCNLLCKNRSMANSLFLFSTSGLGKTHLLHAIGNYFYKNGRERVIKIAYLSSDQFANMMVQAFKNGSFSSFKEFYSNNVDILLLEDIHFFQGKYKMQEELLSIIKILENKGKNVVFTSSFMPKELQKVDSQLASYFCSGLIIPINKPDFDLRYRIIERDIKKLQVSFLPEVCEFVAKSITADIRQLRSCVQNIAFKASLLNKQKVDISIAKDVIQNYVTHEVQINLKEIINLVCNAFRLPIDALKSKSRRRELVIARNTAFYLARRFTELSLKEIGKHLNRRHSTVLKGITTIEKEVKRDSAVGRQVLEIAKRLENKDF